MNPLNLFTKGLKERPGSYKLPGKNVLPNFSGPKALTSSDASNSIPTTSHPEVPQTPNAQSALFEQKQKQSPNGAAKTEEVGPLTDRLADWVRQRVVASRNRPPRNPAVQTELVLDKVKVIRNDLSQDDLEVVAIDQKTAKKTGKKARGKHTESEQTTAAP